MTPKWIHRKIMPEIQKAIDASDRYTHIFYITGLGGEGKTILLRQVGQALGSDGGIAPHFPWSGILDLYHSEVNTSSGLEARLSSVFGKSGDFQKFYDERDAWAARREAGLLGSELEAERARMAEVFAECLNKASRWGRLVIALDTTERIQYELDEVQKLCGLESETTTVRSWLVDQLRRWQNCVVLLVGRPDADGYLGSALQQDLTTCPGVRFHASTLGGFDEDEAAQYFELQKTESSDLAGLDPAFYRRLWEVTAGRPIRLDLAMEVVEHGLGFDRFREQVEASPVQQVRDKIDRLLIDHVMRGEPDDSLRQLLHYLAAARKGMDAELLHHLEPGWSPAECQSRLAALAGREFVKRHADDERLFLHDEMYHLCDTYLLPPDEAQRLSGRIAAWYDRQIALGDDRKRCQDLQVDSLFYRLRADPLKGYRWYAQHADPAIRAAEVGFEMRMRSEVMAFLNSASPVDRRLVRDAPGLLPEFTCDCAPNWVKRLMLRGENRRAIEVAEAVRGAGQAVCPPQAPGSGWALAELAVYDAQARIYSARTPQAVDLLRGVIDQLQGELSPDDLAKQEPGTYTGWRRNLILGRAHNNLGYAYWRYLGHYQAALAQFRAALPYFRASDLSEELANTDDNMGRVWALLRYPTRAETLVDEGLRLRRQEGRIYRVALSQNSRAIVYLEFGAPHRARPLAEQALRVFEDLNAQRGLGLASITLGHAMRDLGGLWDGVYPYEECDRLLRLGATALERAVNIFKGPVHEPLKLAEALNELGCVYRSRAVLEHERSSDRLLVRTISTEAIKYLQESIDLAQEHQLPLLLVDCYEDLARVYFLRRDYDAARDWLEMAESGVPDSYKVRPEKGLAYIPAEECVEEFWLQLGKIELLRGNLAFDIAAADGTQPIAPQALLDTARHYLLSTAYFERFSSEAIGLQETFRQMFSRFRTCSFDDLEYLRGRLPVLAGEYGISLERLGKFFEDTLGLAIDWPTDR